MTASFKAPGVNRGTLGTLGNARVGRAVPQRLLANMRTALLVFVVSCCASVAYAADEKPGADAVVVKVLDSALPSKENEEEKFLWKHFANKPEEQKFNSYGTDKWKDNFSLFAKSLVQKADNQNLDSASLSKALDLVLNDSKDKIAYLPVGAYQTTMDGRPVWIITVKWEYPLMGENTDLGHIRMFVFDQKTLKQVGFVTCG
jgi:hypothetical protein